MRWTSVRNRVVESQQQVGKVVVMEKAQKQKSVIRFCCGQQGHFARGSALPRKISDQEN